MVLNLGEEEWRVEVGKSTNGVALTSTSSLKLFIGGLTWETYKDSMKTYFMQFGDILEVVVIDKSTGRSKGYGFVTFREPDVAMRACVDPTPVIDGRRDCCRNPFFYCCC